MFGSENIIFGILAVICLVIFFLSLRGWFSPNKPMTGEEADEVAETSLHLSKNDDDE